MCERLLKRYRFNCTKCIPESVEDKHIRHRAYLLQDKAYTFMKAEID